MDKSKVFTLAGTAGVLLCRTVVWWYKRPQQMDSQSKSKSQLEMEKMHSDVWNTALFFPDYFPERENSTTRRLIWYLEQSESTLDISVMFFNFGMLKGALRRLAKKGVEVRIISDGKCYLRDQGIRVRNKHHIMKSTLCDMYIDTMHHKFAVIDNSAVLTGSLNWTRSGITENTENVLITNNPRIVEKYASEFKRLWIESRPRANGSFGPPHTDVKPISEEQ